MSQSWKASSRTRPSACRRISRRWRAKAALPDLGWHYLSNATLFYVACFVLCDLCRLKDHHSLPCCSPLLKKKTALDK